MTEPSELREALRSALSGVAAEVYDFAADTVVAPAIVIQAGDPFIVFDHTMTANQVNLEWAWELWLLVGLGDVRSTYTTLDSLIVETAETIYSDNTLGGVADIAVISEIEQPALLELADGLYLSSVLQLAIQTE